ncbi:MAG: GNAT family N-acetyltransferase [Oscillospiraceae bacterium]|jgi:GNAT superfamily N-acetyltransferase|nr:GNAT family N-acetyltransferase [Oscillospiraceae bacterium]
MVEIRRINGSEVREALDLATEVFLEFEAPDYQPEGVEVFRQFIENDEFILKCQNGVCPIYAAFDEGKMVGMMGMRQDRAHITLAFTRKEYHRRGVATSIFRFLLEDVLQDNPSLKEITLNSSPYGKPFYLHIGFLPLSEEKEMGGVRFTPMKYII